MTIRTPGLPVVAHTDHTSEHGGAELALRRLVDGAEGLWQPRIVLPSGIRAGAFEGVPEIRRIGPAQPAGAATTRNPLAIAGMAGRLLGQVGLLRIAPEMSEVDVVHANSTRAGLYTALAIGGRKPLVVHLRDLVSRESLGSVSYRAFSRLALPRADAVIANSTATLESAVAFLSPTAHAAVVKSPIGTRNHSGPLPPVGERVRSIGMVARLAPWKGQELLMRAFAEVYGGTDVQLHFFGGSPFGSEDYERTLRALQFELGIAGQTVFHGHVEDVDSAIRGLDVCVHASLRPEPLGQNVMQYLAAGRPTIAVDAGGPAELIEHGRNGLLTRMGSQSSLVEALRSLDASSALRMRLMKGALADPSESDREICESHVEVFCAAAARFRKIK